MQLLKKKSDSCLFLWNPNTSFHPCVFLPRSCSSTIPWRDWGQVWGVWTTSSPTLSSPESTGPNRRRRILWECGDDQSHKLGDGVSWMISCLRPNTLFHISVSRDNTCFCTHFHPVPFFFFCTRLAKKRCFILSCKLPISLSHWGGTELFLCAGNTQQQLCGAIIIINNNLNTKWPHRWRFALTLLLTRTWDWSRNDTTLMFSQQPSSEACFFFSKLTSS